MEVRKIPTMNRTRSTLFASENDQITKGEKENSCPNDLLTTDSKHRQVQRGGLQSSFKGLRKEGKKEKDVRARGVQRVGVNEPRMFKKNSTASLGLRF